MEPTRADIQEKIDQLSKKPKATDETVYDGIREWLLSGEMSEFHTNRILEDLASYENYGD